MKKIWIILLIFAILIPSVFWLFHSGFFQTDDGEWMIIRFSAFFQALRGGQFPVRFLERLNFGYGYPVPNFLYPGFLYLSVPIHVLGFSFVNTIKVVLGVSLISSFVFSYFWLKKIFDRKSAFVGAAFYLYAPYHLFDVYTRGSVGEVLALAIVPFILWQYERKSFLLSSLGIGFLILSHNSLALFFLPIIFIYAFIRKKISIIKLLLSFVLGVCLSSFFIIPAMYELSFTAFSKTEISNPSAYFASIFLIGISTIVVLVFSLIQFRQQKITSVLFIFVLILSIIFSSSLSSIFWKLIPSSFIQFPFRLLSLGVLSASFLAAGIVYNIKKQKLLVSFILISLMFVSSFSFLSPKNFFEKDESLYVTNEATTTVQDEYMPIWVKEKPKEHYKTKVEIVKGDGKVDNIVSKGNGISFASSLNENGIVRINTLYYPGWEAIVNGKTTQINYNNNKGVMELNLNKGENQVSLKFGETPLRLFSDLLSILSFVFILVFSFASWKRSKII